MQQQRLEAKVLRYVEAVLAGRRIEDDRVECKSEWPEDHRKAARQIAGLANAARGESILWLVGIDDARGRLTDPGASDPAEWWPRVSRWFAQLAPELSILTVPLSGGAVIALEFDTSRSPYVVTTRGEGGVDREIPWREGTALRSAHRSELLQSLVGEAQVPRFDVISAELRVQHHADRYNYKPGTLLLETMVRAYLEAPEPVRLPEHRWTLEVAAGDVTHSLPFEIEGPHTFAPSQSQLSFRGPLISLGAIRYVKDSGLEIEGSEQVIITSRDAIDNGVPDLVEAFRAARRVSLAASFPVALSSRVAHFGVDLARTRRPTLHNSPYDKINETYDLRLAEFTLGGRPHTDDYSGVRIRKSDFEREPWPDKKGPKLSAPAPGEM